MFFGHISVTKKVFSTIFFFLSFKSLSNVFNKSQSQIINFYPSTFEKGVKDDNNQKIYLEFK